MSRKEFTHNECVAKVLLETVVGLQNIQLGDRPDITYGEGNGIEVTTAVFEDDLRSQNIIERRLAGKKADPFPDGYFETKYAIFGPTMVSDDTLISDKTIRTTRQAVELIKKAIDKKRKKVKSYPIKTKELFTDVVLCVDRDFELKEIGRYIYEYAKNDFDIIYIYVQDAECILKCQASGIDVHRFDPLKINNCM